MGKGREKKGREQWKRKDKSTKRYFNQENGDEEERSLPIELRNSAEGKVLFGAKIPSI